MSTKLDIVKGDIILLRMETEKNSEKRKPVVLKQVGHGRVHKRNCLPRKAKDEAKKRLNPYKAQKAYIETEERLQTMLQSCTYTPPTYDILDWQTLE